MDVTNATGDLDISVWWRKRSRMACWFQGIPVIGSLSRLRSGVNHVLRTRPEERLAEWDELKQRDTGAVERILERIREYNGWKSSCFLPGDSFRLLTLFCNRMELLNAICLDLKVGEKEDNPVKDLLLYGDLLPRWWFLPSDSIDGDLKGLITSVIDQKHRKPVASDDIALCHECRTHCVDEQLVSFGSLKICATCKPLVVQRIKEGVQ